VLPAGEIDAARHVAERALRTIAMTSERDNFNMRLYCIMCAGTYKLHARPTAVVRSSTFCC
jgi:hypothetical protein